MTFYDVKIVLDNLKKERIAQNIGVNKKQAQFITPEMESKLWREGILGDDTREKLRDSVPFFAWN